MLDLRFECMKSREEVSGFFSCQALAALLFPRRTKMKRTRPTARFPQAVALRVSCENTTLGYLRSALMALIVRFARRELFPLQREKKKELQKNALCISARSATRRRRGHTSASSSRQAKTERVVFTNTQTSMLPGISRKRNVRSKI